MNKQLWNVFMQTGNVEAYLLLKQLEKNNSNHVDYTNHEAIITSDVNDMKVD